MTITQYKSDTCFITLMQIRTDPPKNNFIGFDLIHGEVSDFLFNKCGFILYESQFQKLNKCC